MAEQEKMENQKTIVAFAAGLLIGGLLVWVFGGNTPRTETPADDSNATTAMENTQPDQMSDSEATPTTENETTPATPVMEQGEGAASVSNQEAGSSVTLASATFPTDEGWVGVRDYVNGQLGGILGVARFSKEQGLVPETITLQRATKADSTYAIVFFSDNGDRVFNIANDKQTVGVAGTFTAQ